MLPGKVELQENHPGEEVRLEELKEENCRAGGGALKEEDGDDQLGDAHHRLDGIVDEGKGVQRVAVAVVGLRRAELL